MASRTGSAWGKSVYDLFEHLVNQPWQIGEETDYFYDGAVPDCYFGARLDLYLLAMGAGAAIEPSYFVDLRCQDNELELWYGWDRGTHHLARAWRLGKWRQDVSEPLREWGLSPSTVGTTQQVANLEDVHREVEHELKALFRRLDDAVQTGRYRLTWAEVAVILHRFTERWNKHNQDKQSDGLSDDPPTALMRDTYARLGHRERGEPLELCIVHTNSKKPLVTIKAARDHWGWRLDIFTALCPDIIDLKLACPWFGGIAFSGDSGNPPFIRPCPLGHRHQDGIERTAPWSLFESFQEDWLPLLNDRYVKWGTDTYQPAAFGQRIQSDPSGVVWRWLSESGLPRPAYCGTDPRTGHEYWRLAEANFLIIVDPVRLCVVAYAVGEDRTSS